jgi:D-alanine-D-alanine ligase
MSTIFRKPGKYLKLTGKWFYMKIGVLMGGRSPEREISLKTGNNILSGLKNAGFEVVGIDACENVVEDIKREKIDLAFVALHGPLGEDGTIQGLLEFLDVPYTGSGVLASALAMDKIMTKRVIHHMGVPTPAYYVVESHLLDSSVGFEEIEKRRKLAGLEIPVIVKPSIGGSTIGTHIVRHEKDLPAAYKDAAKYCNEVLVERFVPGIEITVGILGDETPFALPVIEIIAEGGFYNYTTKYQPGMSTHIIPARIPEDLYKKSQEYAIEVFRAIGCYGMGRVDFIIENNNLWCLEINTIPGMTETSLLPETAAKHGIDFETLLKNQVEYAFKRYEKMKRVTRKIEVNQIS